MFEKCKKADIYDKGGSMVCQARVSVSHAGQILLIIPRSAVYKPRAPHRVVFYDPVLGRVTCNCRLSASVPLANSDLCSLRCEVLEQLAQNQRRQDVKVPLGENILLHAVYQPKEAGKFPEGGFPANIVNISAGGVYVRAPVLLDKGRRIWFDYVINDETLTLSAQVLRVENGPPAQNQHLYGYGCKFIDMLSRQEAMLRSYIFHLQRQQRREQMG